MQGLHRTPVLPVAVLLLSCGLAPAFADDAPASATAAAPPANELRAGVYFVHYAATAADVSGPFTPAGINLSVQKINTPYLSYLRRLDDHWDLEFAGGIPPTTHTFGKGPATLGSVPFNGVEVATAKWLSPSVLIDYKFMDEGSAWRPYVGLGLNYTRFYDRQSTAAGDAANGGPTSISLSSSWGPAGAAGVSFRLMDNVSLVVAFSLARVTSHYQSDTSGVVRETTVHFNPRAWVLALGYAF